MPTLTPKTGSSSSSTPTWAELLAAAKVGLQNLLSSEVDEVEVTGANGGTQRYRRRDVNKLMALIDVLEKKTSKESGGRTVALAVFRRS